MYNHPFLIFLLWCSLSPLAQGQNSLALERKPIGPLINTAYHESTPVLSPDGQTLYISRIGHPENIGGKASDIWKSQKQADGSWSKLQNIGAPLNNAGPNSLLSLSDNGKIAWLSNQYAADGSLENAGISFSRKNATGWSMPKAVLIDDFYLNSTYATYAVSSDGKVLIMGVERDDSNGLLDLYFCFRKSANSWSKPLNMGRQLNTSANEFAASLSPDNQLLYFVSEGHSGYGRADLFVSRRLDNSWTSWSKPQNLGASVNTDKWDSFLCLQENGTQAFLVSQTEHNASLDVFETVLPPFAHVAQNRIISGRVIDAKTKQNLEALIRINNSEFKESKFGNFELSLPKNEAQELIFELRGYYTIVEKIPAGKQTKELLISLIPLEAGQEINLANIHFEANKTTLLPSSIPELEQLLKVLQTYPEMEIEVAGHTSGHTQELQLLSEQRATAIRDYLSSRGIHSQRIKVIGLGGTQPIAVNDSEENKQRNRRVSFKVLRMK